MDSSASNQEMVKVPDIPTDGQVKIENGKYYTYSNPPGEWREQSVVYGPLNRPPRDVDLNVDVDVDVDEP